MTTAGRNDIHIRLIEQQVFPKPKCYAASGGPGSVSGFRFWCDYYRGKIEGDTRTQRPVVTKNFAGICLRDDGLGANPMR